ncbi:PEP-CTERM sorting domain-containing protein [Emcibacter sp.]|uniref:PEP-CTERM sorting domain-containing protein n=1 Tax=Emcibacter sp. TaxID=1979954 RepID=UPI003A8E0036
MFKKSFALLTLLAGLVPVSSLAAPFYTVEVLHGLEDNYNTQAFGLNDHGQVVGISIDNNDNFSALFWENGTTTDLGLTGLYGGYARAINNNSQVVGFQWDDFPFDESPYVWQSGSLTDLSHPDNEYSKSYAINNNGQVLITSTYGSFSGDKSFIWSQGSGFTEIDHSGLGDTQSVTMRALNDTGQIAGDFRNADGDAQPFFRDSDGTYHIIPLTGDDAFVQGINENGEVVGFIYKLEYDPDTLELISEDQIAFKWSEADGLTILEDGGYGFSNAYDLSDDGVIVGRVETEDYWQIGTLWENGNLLELNNLISLNDPIFGLLHIADAHGINKWGQIAASGTLLETGEQVALLLTPEGLVLPVPAPAALGLMIMGTGLLLYRRRRP